MELPQSKQRLKYQDAVREIEGELEALAPQAASAEKVAALQARLDHFAERYQYEEALGTARYKLYELQARLHYMRQEDEQALDFIAQAVDMRGSVYASAERLKQDIAARAIAPAVDGVRFFYRSPVAVFWFSFVTLGLYNIYWFYKHWRTIRLSTGVRTWPILSAIFQVFTAYSLFKRIRDAAKAHGYEIGGVGWLTAAYIVVIVISNSVARIELQYSLAGTTTQAIDIVALVLTIVFGVCIALIPALIQKAANVYSVATLGPHHAFRKAYVGEIVVVIIGAVLFLFTLYQYGTDIATNQYPRGSQTEISEQDVLAESLRIQYDECSTALNARYNSLDTTDGAAVDAYNADYDVCEDTRLRFNQAVDRYNWLAGFSDE